MTSKRRIVRVTANFERNLSEVRQFLADQGAGSVFEGLLADLFDTVIPNLEAFPEMGRDFLARVPLSVEGQIRRDRVVGLAGKRRALREYIKGDYLILYSIDDTALALLAIRHHRQLSFDLKGHWT